MRRKYMPQKVGYAEPFPPVNNQLFFRFRYESGLGNCQDRRGGTGEFAQDGFSPSALLTGRFRCPRAEHGSTAGFHRAVAVLRKLRKILPLLPFFLRIRRRAF